MKNIFISPLLTSQRVKHELSEYSRSTLTTEKLNYALKVSLTNNTSVNQTYRRTISMTTIATISSKITAKYEVIAAEIGASVSTSNTVSETIEVLIVPKKTVKVYGYVCNDVYSNLKDKQKIELYY